MESNQFFLPLSGKDIIEVIKENRDVIICQLMNELLLREFLERNHSITDISPIKIEFIKRSLKELQSSTIELFHYGPLIMEIKKTGSTRISKKHERFFYDDIKKSIRNYL